MLIARSCHQRRQSPAFRRRLAPALSTISAVLTAAALVCPVAAEQGAPVPRYDRRVLSEIAQDVLRRAASGPDQPVARVSLPTRQPDEGVAAAGSAADLAPPATDIGCRRGSRGAGAPEPDTFTRPVPSSQARTST